ncbi:MAG: hypothetical protein HRT90_00710 [Candidatus Margulisbacteria bacterium]|nr:hypothetical protein [Candidatus Margulisiibacteriota bacterium]
MNGISGISSGSGGNGRRPNQNRSVGSYNRGGMMRPVGANNLPPEVNRILEKYVDRSLMLIESIDTERLLQDRNGEEMLDTLKIIAAEPMKLLDMDLSLFKDLSPVGDQKLIQEMQEHAKQIKDLVSRSNIEKDAITKACEKMLKIQAKEFGETMQIRLEAVMQSNMMKFQESLEGMIERGIQQGIAAALEALGINDLKSRGITHRSLTKTPPSVSPISKSKLESKLGGQADFVKCDLQDGFSEDKFKEYYGDEPNYEDLVAYFRILVAEKNQDRHSRTSFNIQPPVESRHQKGQINNR